MSNKNKPYAELTNDNLPEHVISLSEAQTLDGLFRARVARTPDSEAYRFFDAEQQQWQAYSWREVSEQVGRWQTALLGLNYEPGDRIAIMLENGIHWPIVDQAALGLGLILVPLFANDRAENIAYVLADSGARFLLIRGQEQADQLLQVEDKLDGLFLCALDQVKADGLNITYVPDWLPEQGEQVVKEHDPDSLASIVYTSGTTGLPKGVMLSHKNMLWNAWAGIHSMMVYPEDQHLSFLPLTHTLERTVGYYLMMMVGAKVAYNRSIPELADDLQIIKPTIMITVPRIFERVHAKIQDKLDNGSIISKGLFHLATALGWRKFEVDQGRAKWHPGLLIEPFLSSLVAKKLQARLGGKVRIGIVGGAAMPPQIAKIFIGLGVPLLQGYGLTETSPIISVNKHEHNDPKTVGELLRDVALLIDPETDELKVKSPGVMLGYWNRPNATQETFDTNGWLCTGDKASYNDKMLTITGRIKEILVLANGEKVPPVDIESALCLEPLIEQALVLGEGRPYLSALLVLNPEIKAALLKKHRKEKPGVKQAKWLDALLKRRMRRQLRGFPGYARVYEYAVIDEEWTVENQLLTPTLKAKRARIIERFQDSVDGLYEGH